MNSEKPNANRLHGSAFIFLLLMAVASLFNDMTFEGANSVLGSFEDFLGAPTMVIAVVGGVAALLGSSLRILFGYLTDKTGKYWLFTILGYAIDMAAVPCLALVPRNGWVLAIVFILAERVGKAIKKPAKSSLMSFASKQLGEGKSFALGEAMDQIGACLGPLLLTGIYLFMGEAERYLKYIVGFACLAIPGSLCVMMLVLAKRKYPNPEQFEASKPKEQLGSFWKSKAFMLFVFAAAIFAAGYMDSFSLINKHIYSLGIISVENLPLLYSYAMFIDAISALFFGFLYDKVSFASVGLAALLTAPYAFCFFLTDKLWAIFLGLTAWGIGMGAMESVLLSGVATLSRKEERARAYGFFELFYGLSSFGFSFLVAYLYDTSAMALCIFSCVCVAVAAALFFLCSPLSKSKGENKEMKIDENASK